MANTVTTLEKRDAVVAVMEKVKELENTLGKPKNSLLHKMTLSLCMITKNEEEFLERCINSVKSIVDEIILVDTGSTDKTKEIAKSLGAKVFDYEWEDDFSKARNKSLEHATSDWILILDADEVMDKKDLDKLKSLTQEEHNIDGYSFITKNFSNNFRITGWRSCKSTNGFYGWHASKKTRLFKNKKEYKFRGAIHELIDYSILKNKGKIKLAQVPILHFQKFSKEKTEYYLSLGEKKIKKNPNDIKAHLDFANQNKIIGNTQIAIEEFKKVIFLCKEKGNFYIKANLNLGLIFLENKDLEKSKKYFKEALYVDKNNTDALANIGSIYYKLNDFKKAEEYFKKTLNINKNNVLALINLGATYQKLNKYTESIAVLDKAVLINPHNPEAFFNLGVAYGKLSDFETALKTLMIAYQRDYPNKAKLIGMINFAKQQVDKNQKDIKYEFKVK